MSADAEALAESIRSEPGVEATAPVAVSVGGAEGLMMDVAFAAGAPMTVAVDENGNLCNYEVLSPLFDRDAIVSMTADSATVRTTGERMRLYLFDAPEGSSTRVLAIAIVAPESRFESVVERAMPDRRIDRVPHPVTGIGSMEGGWMRSHHGPVLALALMVGLAGCTASRASTSPVESTAGATDTTSSTAPAPASPILGSWVSTDNRYSESHATLVIEASEDGSVEIVAHNFATPCLPVPTTMVGTGRLQGENELVIPAPVFTCDDGSQPDPEFLELSLTEFAEQFQNLTFTRDTATDILTGGGVWIREGAEERGPESTTPHSETEITELLNGFIEARIAGDGAQQYLNVPEEDISLLYATSAGAPYERGEFARVNRYEWPYGWTGFKVRLFAGDTVVEQLFFIGAAGRLGLDHGGFIADIALTTENGQPLYQENSAFGGEVTIYVAHPWVTFSSEENSIILIPAGAAPTTDGGERHGWNRFKLTADPGTVDADCRAGPAPTDAEALAETIRSYPGFETTAPVAVGAAGTARGLMMDVKIAAGADACTTGVLGRLRSGHLMRLYLFDAPEGSSMQILAIPLVVPESDFERAMEATAPIAVEFHAP